MPATSPRPRCVRIRGAVALGAAFNLTSAPRLALGADPVVQLSRPQAIARALGENPSIAAQRAVEDQARAHTSLARAAALPSVVLLTGVGPSLTAKRVPGTAVDSTQNAYGDVSLDDLSVVLAARLDVIQPLYTFGKIEERRRAAELELVARRAQTRVTEGEVALRVAELYEGWLLARDMQGFFDETERWLRAEVENTRQEIAQHSNIPASDLLEFEAALGAVALAVHEAHAGALKAEAGLVAYLGYPRGTKLRPQENSLEVLARPEMTIPALVDVALRQRPELAALRAGEQSLHALARAEAAGALPDLFAAGFVSGAYTPHREWVSSRYVVDPLGHFVPGAMVGVRWQLGGAEARARSDERQAEGQNLEHTRRWAEAGVPAEVSAARADIERAVADLASTESALATAKRWLVAASSDYGIGLGDSRSVTDAATAVIRLRTAQLDATYRNNVGLATLAKATGTLAGAAPAERLYPNRDGS